METHLLMILMNYKIIQFSYLMEVLLLGLNLKYSTQTNG